ncbi:MAG TPA: hypothetical protein V6D15_10905 [Oculatellaceae cyanobacterium]|jgi:hypothetical protein
MAKVGKRKLNSGHGTKTYTPLEDSFQLVSMLRIALGGRKIGAYIQKKGANSIKIRFGWECRGIHTTLRPDEIDTVFDALEAGLKDLPDSEELTVHLGSFTDDQERQEQLASLLKVAPNNELQYLVMAERARVQELTKKGIRKPKFLRLYATYTVEPDTQGSADLIEKWLVRIEKYWKSFIGELQGTEYVRYERLFYSAFTDGYEFWNHLLSNKMGLDIRSLTDEELWLHLWQRFNDSPPRQIPQLLILDDDGLREEVYTEVHPTTLLMESATAVPFADRQWVYLKNKYIGMLTFVDKPGGWSCKEAQMRYLWEVIAQEKVFDTEVFCQLTRANEAIVKTNMQRLTKQANTASKLAQDSNSIDVMSMINIKKSVAAQEELYEGAIPIHTAVAFLVYRRSRAQLDEACRYLTSLFLRPAWVLRETEYAWRIWLQTFPIIWERLLTHPFNRRQVYLSGEVPGLMPLVRTCSWDKSGFELISEEGGTPIFLDLCKNHRNIGLFGTTRSGKSVLASGMLTQVLAYGLPVVAMDYPKPDGSSTFSDYTDFLGDDGGYFDVGKESSNLFELPDLKSLDPQLQRERFEDYQEFLASALMTMVVGRVGSTQPQTKVFNDTIRSILALALDAFFGDIQIRDRYAQAYINGFGSTQWQSMPTLNDFFSYCSIERLRLSSISGDVKAALEQIKLRLRFWLSSRVGKSISSPSTFRSNARMLVFALRNLSSDEDAAILALSAYSAALRRALSSPASIFFIDEAPILFEFESIAALIGRLCANGAKSGIRVIL